MDRQENAMGALEVSMEPVLVAISDRYASRGIAKAARQEAEGQIKREKETRELAPEAYRLSQYSDRAVSGLYRRGKDAMNGEDLVRYFEETRSMRVSDADFSLCEESECQPPVRDLTQPTEEELLERLPAERSALQSVKALPVALYQRVKEGIPAWFDSSAADTSRNRRSFPLSAFVSLAVVAMCLMLIVASNVMLTHAEDKLSTLTVEIDALTAEVADIEAKMNVKTDLLLIREIAINEYGMVGEEYVRMDYVTLHQKDVIEAYDGEEGRGVGLAAILSAIGIK